MSPKWKGLEMPAEVVCDESVQKENYSRFVIEPLSFRRLKE
jgi:hypothetical protein